MTEEIEFDVHKLDYIDITAALTPLGLYNDGKLYASPYGFVNTNWYSIKGITE